MGDGSGERRQRTGTAADPGLGVIQDYVDLAAQAATRHGASGTGPAGWVGRGTGTEAWEEGLGRSGCGGGRSRGRAHPAQARADASAASLEAFIL